MSIETASVYFAIKSVDEEQRLVYGRATQETLDRQGEVLDYEASKPYWEEWIKESQEASGGKSMGNVRVMHRPDIAAGKLVRVDFNDQEKSIDVAAKVVDDAEWQKVLEGVYTGFSQGGKYISKKNDPLVTGFGGMPAVRVVIAPKELSLVDRPAVPSATFFEVVKADGSTEQRSFKGDSMSEQTELPIAEEAKKGIWQGRMFLSLLEECNWLLSELKSEREREGDASPIPEKLEVCLGTLAGLCEEYIGEQLAELKAGGSVAAASEAGGEDDEEGDKADADSDAEKAAKTGQKALRAAMCSKVAELVAAHKSYMDTYATGADKADDEIDAQKAAPADDAAKSAPIPSVDEIAAAVLAAIDKRAEDAAKAVPPASHRPATKLVPVERGDDANKTEELFDARKAAFEAPSAVDAFRVMFQNPEAFRI